MSRSNQNPVIPPRPDVSYMAGGHGSSSRPPPPPERTHSRESQGHPRETHSYPREAPPPHAQSKTPIRREPPAIPPHPDADWIEREELRMRELEEARARAAQMEKTMRWWSDCTANWREKWSKVRNERNKAREECRQIRAKLETSVKEYSNIKRERNEMKTEVINLKKLVEQLQLSVGASQTDSTVVDKSKDLPEASICSSESHKSAGSDQDIQSTITNTDTVDAKQPNSSSSSNANAAGGGTQEDFVSKLLLRKDKDGEHSSSSGQSDKSEKKKLRKSAESSSTDDILVQQKLSMLQLKLEEAQKTIKAEREAKTSLSQSVEAAQSELSDVRFKYDELTTVKEDALLQLTRLREEHEKTLGQMSSELEDESTRGNSMDRRIADLRKELEKLQQENASEWGKRERLETEKLSLERENKKIKKELEALEEEIQRKNQQSTALLDADIKATKLELTDKTRELAELRHVCSKQKKLLAEKAAELDHAKSRAEGYEAEVKRLRARVDELKKDLANVQDDADQNAHQVRKLQRSNDELQQQVENLSVQVQHLQTRLLRCNPSMSSSSMATSLKSLDISDSATEGDDNAD